MVIFSVLVVVLSRAQAGTADSEVSGIFKGNDRPAKLSFVSAQKGTPVGGKETIKLVFTEKDHSRDERPDLKALFGDYGSVLLIGIQPDGKVLTCDVAHEALKQKPSSSPASVKMSEFKNLGGQISGKIATDGKAEAFGQTREVNLTFSAKAPWQQSKNSAGTAKKAEVSSQQSAVSDTLVAIVRNNVVPFVDILLRQSCAATRKERATKVMTHSKQS